SVCAINNLTHPDFRHEVAQPFIAEDHRIHEDLFLEVVAHVSFVRTFGDLVDITSDVRATEIRGQKASSMGAANFHAWKAVERPIENHSREEKRGFERVSYHISKVAEGAVFDDVGRSLGMHEDQNTKLLNLRPERIVFWRGGYLSPGMAGD